jgi:hypothetical protein
MIESDIKPKSPLPWMSSLGDIVGADKIPVVVEISAQNADYIVEAANAYPGLAEKDAEITRLRERVALLDGLLGECLRHHYYDDDQVSQSWLAEARQTVTSTTGRPVPSPE